MILLYKTVNLGKDIGDFHDDKMYYLSDIVHCSDSFIQRMNERERRKDRRLGLICIIFCMF